MIPVPKYLYLDYSLRIGICDFAKSVTAYIDDIVCSVHNTGRYRIFGYLNKYYGLNVFGRLVLENLKFPNAFDTIDKPFIRFHTLWLQNCRFGSEFSFTKYFPSVYHLYSIVYDNPKIISENWPRLREISIENASIKRNKEFLWSNSQLTSVTLFKNFNPALIRYIGKNIPNLASLELYDIRHRFYDEQLKTIHLNNIKSNKIYPKAFSFKTFKTIPFSFDKLERLVIRIHLDQRTLDVIAKLRCLKQLTIDR